MQAEDAGHKKTRGTRLRELTDRTRWSFVHGTTQQSGSSSPAPQRRAACVSSRNSPSDSAGGDGRAIHCSERSSIQRSASSCAHDMRKLLLRTFVVPRSRAMRLNRMGERTKVKSLRSTGLSSCQQHLENNISRRMQPRCQRYRGGLPAAPRAGARCASAGRSPPRCPRTRGASRCSAAPPAPSTPPAAAAPTAGCGSQGMSMVPRRVGTLGSAAGSRCAGNRA